MMDLVHALIDRLVRPTKDELAARRQHKAYLEDAQERKEVEHSPRRSPSPATQRTNTETVA